MLAARRHWHKQRRMWNTQLRRGCSCRSSTRARARTEHLQKQYEQQHTVTSEVRQKYGKRTSARASIEPATRIVQEQRDKKQQERRRTTTRNSTKLNRLGGLAGCHLKLRNCYFLMSKLQAESRLSTLSRFVSPTMLDILVSSSILGILTNYSKRRPVARTPPDWSYTDICGSTTLAWPRSCSRLP